MLNNLQVALNIAPLLSRSLSMQQRLECAVSGFVCLDIFSLLASDKCAQLHLPTGSCFMASQTLVNLQACALAAVVITATKQESTNLWRHGHARVSEIAIEQFFGQLRQQTATAQFGCRGYWQASARHAMWMSKQLDKEKVRPDGGEAPLSNEEFLA